MPVSGLSMIKFPRSLGHTAAYAVLGALVLSVSASGQGYPQQPYPAQQPYPNQGYPNQGYPNQGYPNQGYPNQGYPNRGYPGQSYPAQGQPAPQGYPAAQAAPAAAPAASSPVCVRLEAQLATLNSGSGNSALADQIKRSEDAIARQQADLDRAVERGRRLGCANQGLFSLFSGFSPQCGPINSQIDQMRNNLDRMMSDLEQLKSGNNDQQSQRNVLIGQLAQNNCGAQYTAAARAAGPQGFFEALLGGGGTIENPAGNGGPSGTYRTVCVRTCDGFYFPISYSTVPSRFPADAQACQRLCPASQAALYTFHNPGEAIEQAVSADGSAPYTALPNAFRYRKEIVSGCSCRAAGQTWAQALRNADDSSTLESGDIVVTDQNEKTLTRIPGAAKPPATAAAKPAATAAPQGSGSDNAVVTDPKNRKVRVVGPPFLSQQ